MKHKPATKIFAIRRSIQFDEHFFQPISFHFASFFRGGSVSEKNRILRDREVLHRTGLSKTTRWRLEQKGEFPLRVRLSETGKANGYYETEINAWINTRTRGFREQPLEFRAKTEAET